MKPVKWLLDDSRYSAIDRNSIGFWLTESSVNSDFKSSSVSLAALCNIYLHTSREHITYLSLLFAVRLNCIFEGSDFYRLDCGVSWEPQYYFLAASLYWKMRLQVVTVHDKVRTIFRNRWGRSVDWVWNSSLPGKLSYTANNLLSQVKPVFRSSILAARCLWKLEYYTCAQARLELEQINIGWETLFVKQVKLGMQWQQFDWPEKLRPYTDLSGCRPLPICCWYLPYYVCWNFARKRILIVT